MSPFERRVGLKAAFITQDIGNDICKLEARGSAQSLKNLLQNLEGVEVTLVAPGKQHRRSPLVEEIRGWFGNHTVADVVYFPLPVANIFEGRSSKLRHRAIDALKTLRWWMQQQRLIAFLQEEKFDFVHLNSITLYSLLSICPLPTFLHIREMLDVPFLKKNTLFRQADGIICIDAATRAQLGQMTVPPTTVLTNPVDMRHVGDMGDPIELCKTYGVDANRIILAMIGRLSQVKGTDIVIQAVRQSTNKNLELLVVGQGLRDYYERRCRELAGNDSRIHFVGVEHQIGKVYRIADYIIRGDPDFRVGRTLLEGLYSGCYIISPGSSVELQKESRLLNWEKRFIWYKNRDESDLTNVFNSLCGKVYDRNYSSNIKIYADEFMSFILGVLETCPKSSMDHADNGSSYNENTSSRDPGR